MKASVAVGIDLGATNLKGAVVDRAGRILSQQTQPLIETEPDSVIEDMVRMVGGLMSAASLARSELLGVGVGSPGPLSHRSGRIIRAANLPGWVDVPLRDRLGERIGAPVVLENDGNAAAYGEYWAGAGRDGGDLVMLTLGTGVGAGVVLDGRILHGHFENAAELGHSIVVLDGLPCACGQRGCLEQYSSASAVARRTAHAIELGESSVVAEAIGGRETIDARLVAECAQTGDAVCLRIWDEACRYLAVTCVNIQHAFNPERVVLGGGMSEAGNFLVDRVTDHVSRQRWSLYDDVPQITLAELGYEAGMIGAAGLIWQDAG